MQVLITLPTFARDVAPEQLVQHDGATWFVDEVSRQRGGQVAIALRPAERVDEGRRKIVKFSDEAFVQVLPTFAQRDELASVVADALGTSWLTQVYGLAAQYPTEWGEVLTEEGGVEWNADAGVLSFVFPPETEQWREHSVTLNGIAWKIAEALGMTNGDGKLYASPVELVDRLLEERGPGGSTLNLEDLDVVDAVLRAIERRHPTAIPDHARLIERRGEEAQALAEMHQHDEFCGHSSAPPVTLPLCAKGGIVGPPPSVDELAANLEQSLDGARAARDATRAANLERERAAVGDDFADSAQPAVIITAAGVCPESGVEPGYCDLEHQHVAPAPAQRRIVDNPQA